MTEKVLSPPGFNLVRYLGVLVPRSLWRRWVVPFDPDETGPAQGCGCGVEKQEKKIVVEDMQKENGRHPRNYSWAELLKRVFEIDVLNCDRCGGRMRILCY